MGKLCRSKARASLDFSQELYLGITLKLQGLELHLQQD